MKRSQAEGMKVMEVGMLAPRHLVPKNDNASLLTMFRSGWNKLNASAVSRETLSHIHATSVLALGSSRADLI